MSAAPTASLLLAPLIFAPALCGGGARLIASAAAAAFCAVRDPITTRCPAAAQRKASAPPSCPLPPRTAMVCFSLMRRPRDGAIADAPRCDNGAHRYGPCTGSAETIAHRVPD